MGVFIFDIIILIISVIFTGFITAAEIALSSFGENKIEELKEKGDDIWQKFEIVHKNPEPYYGTIHLLSITFIITAIISAFLVCIKLLYLATTNLELSFNLSAPELIISFFLSVISIASVLTIFNFLVPKALGFKYADILGRFFVIILLPLSKFFLLPAKILNLISNVLLFPFKEKTNFAQAKPSEDEILDILSDGVKSGAIDVNEEKIIKNVIEFNDLKAGEVMVPERK